MRSSRTSTSLRPPASGGRGLLGRKKGGPEGAVVIGYEIGFLGWRRRNERLEIAGQRVEVLPCGDAGTVGRAELGEVGPVALHGAGELELCRGERWARNSYWQIEKILNLGRVSRAVGEGDRGEEILRRVLVIELIGGERDELRHRQVGAQGRASEDRVSTSGAECEVGGWKTGERILRGDDGSDEGSDERGERRFVRGLVVADGPDGEIEVEGDEQAPFVVIAALDYRDMVELAGGQGCAEREREKFTVDIGRVARGILVGENRRDRERAQARSGLTAAARGGGERRPSGLGGGKGLRVEIVSAAFDDGFVKEVGGRGRDELRKDAEAARGFAEDGHIRWIAAEEDDVVANPAKSQLLVHEAVIAGGISIGVAVAIGVGGFRGESGMREKAQRTEAVVDGDDDDAVLHHGRGIVIIALAGDQSTAMDPHHHRAELAVIAVIRSEHVEEEAVLRGGGDAEGRGRLRAVVGELRGVERLEPGCMVYRGAPAPIAHGRGGVRNAEKFTDACGSRGAADETVESEDYRVVRPRERARRHAAKHYGSQESQQHYAKLALVMKDHRFLHEQRNQGNAGNYVCLNHLWVYVNKFPLAASSRRGNVKCDWTAMSSLLDVSHYYVMVTLISRVLCVFVSRSSRLICDKVRR